jgi:hypothetical protein
MGNLKVKIQRKGVFNMTTVIGWGLVVSGAVTLVVKVLTDIGIIPHL